MMGPQVGDDASIFTIENIARVSATIARLRAELVQERHQAADYEQLAFYAMENHLLTEYQNAANELLADHAVAGARAAAYGCAVASVLLTESREELCRAADAHEAQVQVLSAEVSDYRRRAEHEPHKQQHWQSQQQNAQRDSNVPTVPAVSNSSGGQQGRSSLSPRHELTSSRAELEGTDEGSSPNRSPPPMPAASAPSPMRRRSTDADLPSSKPQPQSASRLQSANDAVNMNRSQTSDVQEGGLPTFDRTVVDRSESASVSGGRSAAPPGLIDTLYLGGDSVAVSGNASPSLSRSAGQLPRLDIVSPDGDTLTPPAVPDALPTTNVPHPHPHQHSDRNSDHGVRETIRRDDGSVAAVHTDTAAAAVTAQLEEQRGAFAAELRRLEAELLQERDARRDREQSERDAARQREEEHRRAMDAEIRAVRNEWAAQREHDEALRRAETERIEAERRDDERRREQERVEELERTRRSEADAEEEEKRKKDEAKAQRARSSSMLLQQELAARDDVIRQLQEQNRHLQHSVMERSSNTLMSTAAYSDSHGGLGSGQASPLSPLGPLPQREMTASSIGSGELNEHQTRSAVPLPATLDGSETHTSTMVRKPGQTAVDQRTSGAGEPTLATTFADKVAFYDRTHSARSEGLDPAAMQRELSDASRDAPAVNRTLSPPEDSAASSGVLATAAAVRTNSAEEIDRDSLASSTHLPSAPSKSQGSAAAFKPVSAVQNAPAPSPVPPVLGAFAPPINQRQQSAPEVGQGSVQGVGQGRSSSSPWLQSFLADVNNSATAQRYLGPSAALSRSPSATSSALLTTTRGVAGAGAHASTTGNSAHPLNNGVTIPKLPVGQGNSAVSGYGAGFTPAFLASSAGGSAVASMTPSVVGSTSPVLTPRDPVGPCAPPSQASVSTGSIPPALVRALQQSHANATSHGGVVHAGGQQPGRGSPQGFMDDLTSGNPTRSQSPRATSPSRLVAAEWDTPDISPRPPSSAPAPTPSAAAVVIAAGTRGDQQGSRSPPRTPIDGDGFAAVPPTAAAAAAPVRDSPSLVSSKEIPAITTATVERPPLGGSGGDTQRSASVYPGLPSVLQGLPLDTQQFLVGELGHLAPPASSTDGSSINGAAFIDPSADERSPTNLQRASGPVRSSRLAVDLHGHGQRQGVEGGAGNAVEQLRPPMGFVSPESAEQRLHSSLLGIEDDDGTSELFSPPPGHRAVRGTSKDPSAEF